MPQLYQETTELQITTTLSKKYSNDQNELYHRKEEDSKREFKKALNETVTSNNLNHKLTEARYIPKLQDRSESITESTEQLTTKIIGLSFSNSAPDTTSTFRPKETLYSKSNVESTTETALEKTRDSISKLTTDLQATGAMFFETTPEHTSISNATIEFGTNESVTEGKF